MLPLKCVNAQYHQIICIVKCHLAPLQHSKSLHENKKLFELNVQFVRIVTR